MIAANLNESDREDSESERAGGQRRAGEGGRLSLRLTVAVKHVQRFKFGSLRRPGPGIRVRGARDWGLRADSDAAARPMFTKRSLRGSLSSPSVRPSSVTNR
eukprot:2652863-Rhodomonas_salina.1